MLTALIECMPVLLRVYHAIFSISSVGHNNRVISNSLSSCTILEFSRIIYLLVTYHDITKYHDINNCKGYEVIFHYMYM